VRIENWFFYDDNLGEPAVGIIDFQLMVRTDVTSDLVWFFCTSVSPAFADAHFEALVALYFAELHKCGGPLVVAGSEEWELWMEAITLSVCVLVNKLIIGLGGTDPALGEHVVPALDFFAHSVFAMWRRLDCAAMWVKFRAGEMAVQRKYPHICRDLGMLPERIPLPKPAAPAFHAAPVSANSSAALLTVDELPEIPKPTTNVAAHQTLRHPLGYAEISPVVISNITTV
jgi:hypothetical protein